MISEKALTRRTRVYEAGIVKLTRPEATTRNRSQVYEQLAYTHPCSAISHSAAPVNPHQIRAAAFPPGVKDARSSSLLVKTI